MPLGVLIMKDDSGAIFEPRQGYRKYTMTNQTYRTQYLVVCSADRIESLLYSLVYAYFPKNVYGIIEFFTLQEKDKSEVETYLSPSLDRDNTLAVFKSYIFQLLNDGQIAFGIAWQEGNQHEEIFVDDHKIITVMTSQELMVEQALGNAGIPALSDLEFVSQHAHGHLNLKAVADLVSDDDKMPGGPEFVTTVYAGDIIKSLSMQKQ